MTMKIEVKVFWVVMPCNIAVGGPYCLHLQGEQQDLPKHWYPTATLHSVTTQNTLT